MATTRFINHDRTAWVTTYFNGVEKSRCYDICVQDGDVVWKKTYTQHELMWELMENGSAQGLYTPEETPLGEKGIDVVQGDTARYQEEPLLKQEQEEPLLKQVDPELERLLDDEEKMARERHRRPVSAQQYQQCGSFFIHTPHWWNPSTFAMNESAKYCTGLS